MNTTPADKPRRNQSNDIELPQPIIESFARMLLPIVMEYYHSEEGQKELAKLRKKREKEVTEAQKGKPDI